MAFFSTASAASMERRGGRQHHGAKTRIWAEWGWRMPFPRDVLAAEP